MNKKKIFILLLTLFLLSSIVVAQRGYSFDPFRPFKDVDVGRMYDEYQKFIDAFIYFIIFIGLAQYTLYKKFEGRGGKAVIIGIGLSLSFAMSWWASEKGFTLKSFGIVAAGIFVALFGFAIFATMRRLGGTSKTATALAYVLTFLALLGVIPAIFEEIAERMPWLYGMGWIIFFVALGMVLFAIPQFFGGGRAREPEIGETPEERRERKGGIKKEKKAEREEKEADRLTRLGERIDLAQTNLAADLEKEEANILRQLEILADAVSELRGIQNEIEVLSKRGLDVSGPEREYDRLVLRIKEGLKGAIESLTKERNNLIKERRASIKNLYEDRIKKIKNKAARMKVKKADAIKRRIDEKIREWETRLNKEITESMLLEKSEFGLFTDAQKRCEEDIKILDRSLDYVETNTRSVSVRRKLNTSTLYSRITEVLRNVKTREKELGKIINLEKVELRLGQEEDKLIKEIRTLISEEERREEGRT